MSALDNLVTQLGGSLEIATICSFNCINLAEGTITADDVELPVCTDCATELIAVRTQNGLDTQVQE